MHCLQLRWEMFTKKQGNDIMEEKGKGHKELWLFFVLANKL